MGDRRAYSRGRQDNYNNRRNWNEPYDRQGRYCVTRESLAIAEMLGVKIDSNYMGQERIARCLSHALSDTGSGTLFPNRLHNGWEFLFDS